MRPERGALRTQSAPTIPLHESVNSSDGSLPERPGPVIPIRQSSDPSISVASAFIHPEVFHPQAPRETRILGVKGESEEQKTDLFEVPAHRSRSITPPPKYDVQHQATCFFLNLFSFQASKKYGIPILDFLPEMLNNSAQNTAIYAASKVVSRVTLADRYSGKDLRLQTGEDYTKALKSVHNTMSNENEAIKDEAVTAVWLLGLYEVCVDALINRRMADDC